VTRASTFLAVAVALLLAGCGGGSSDQKHKSFRAPQLGSSAGLVRGYGASAGSDQSYVPTGKIVADSNFRPWENGFSFENYGNDAGPQNMTPVQVEDIFGSQVCISGSGKTCNLTPPAQQWMDNQNKAMNGGHCMGFSVTALRMFTGSLRAARFGAPSPPKLDIQGNLPLQETIAEDWIYQDLPTVGKATVKGAPDELLKKLEAALNGGGETYTIGIFNATGGHAITPFAVEDKGSGMFNVLVYDNNFPGITRAITFNTNTNAWLYHGGPNPKDLNETYQGTASNQAMVLLPTSPGTHQQPCPFCGRLGSASPRGYSVGSVLGKSEQYDEITLTGNPYNHAHLVLTDEKGRQTGFVNGKIVNDIPGAVVDRSLTIQNWNEAPEPSYRVAVGTFVRVTIDGSDLTKPDKENVTLIGPGKEFDVDEIKLKPGQKDYVSFKGGGTGINYETNADIGSPPQLHAGIVETKGDQITAFEFSAQALVIKGGLNMALVFDKSAGAFGIDTEGTDGSSPIRAPGIADYILILTKADESGKVVQWSADDLQLKGGEPGETAAIDFRKATDPTSSIPVTILGAHDSTRTAEAKPQQH
jgi:hypothetical protein